MNTSDSAFITQRIIDEAMKHRQRAYTPESLLQDAKPDIAPEIEDMEILNRRLIWEVKNLREKDK